MNESSSWRRVLFVLGVTLFAAGWAGRSMIAEQQAHWREALTVDASLSQYDWYAPKGPTREEWEALRWWRHSTYIAQVLGVSLVATSIPFLTRRRVHQPDGRSETSVRPSM